MICVVREGRYQGRRTDGIAGAGGWAAIAARKAKGDRAACAKQKRAWWIERSLARCQRNRPESLRGEISHCALHGGQGGGGPDPPVGSDAFHRAAFALHCLHVPDSS